MELCEEQPKNGRVFVFEHPRWVDSWWEGAVQRVRELENVHVIHTDQCMFGLCGPPEQKEVPQANYLHDQFETWTCAA